MKKAILVRTKVGMDTESSYEIWSFKTSPVH